MIDNKIWAFTWQASQGTRLISPSCSQTPQLGDALERVQIRPEDKGPFLTGGLISIKPPPCPWFVGSGGIHTPRAIREPRLLRNYLQVLN